MKFNLKSLALATVAVATMSTAAIAHPKLVTATPAANATVSGTTTVKLTFSERVIPKLSSATLIMTGMPSMKNHPDTKMTGATSTVAPDGKSLVVTSATALPAGSYRVDWVIVGADTHRITGAHSFSVR